ncbi:DUF2690 domain-containing protein [Streptomyces sp. NPDC088387]|uniref:helix-turn-helix domain-containing protein n=1 Tax=Streptomyces sp. NPDC088387 TaxID=3365859 RepID=UPI003818CC98
MSTEPTRLVGMLRELRARTGLSLAALSERTAYSKSSWERYLNGKSLPPRQAVQDLCRVANEPDGRLLALWEIAESEASGRAAVLASPTGEPRPEPRELPRPEPRVPPRPAEAGRPYGLSIRSNLRTRITVSQVSLASLVSLVSLVAVCALLVGGLALVVLLLPGPDTAEDEPLSASLPYSLAPQCQGADCEGRDPLRLICGIDPDTLTTYRTATGARVELRYSEKCGASWARTWGTRIGDRVEITAGGPTHDVRVSDKNDMETYVYTAMATVGPGSTVRACFRPASADGERECFAARVG